jgi:hypothetical protein
MNCSTCMSGSGSLPQAPGLVFCKVVKHSLAKFGKALPIRALSSGKRFEIPGVWGDCMRAWLALICLGPTLTGGCACPMYPVGRPSFGNSSAYVSTQSDRRDHTKQLPTAARAKADSVRDAAFVRARPDETAELTGAVRAPKTSSSSEVQHRPTPVVGTPAWQTEQAEEQREQRRLDEALKSICRGC